MIEVYGIENLRWKYHLKTLINNKHLQKNNNKCELIKR